MDKETERGKEEEEKKSGRHDEEEEEKTQIKEIQHWQQITFRQAQSTLFTFAHPEEPEARAGAKQEPQFEPHDRIPNAIFKRTSQQ